MKITQKLKELGCRLASKLQGLFDPVSLEELAREKGFIQRSSSQVSGVDFVKLLTTEILAEPRISYEGLCDRLQQLNPAVTITPQALAQRMTGAGAENYLQAVLQRTLNANLQASVEALDSQLLAPFGRIFLQDSTQAQLHERLAEAFKGSGGSASQASVKIDLTYEVKGQAIYRLEVGAGATSDQSRAEALVETLQATDLVIRDLGYFKLTALAKMAAKGAFFLSRLLPAAGVYRSERAEEEALGLARYCNQQHADQAVIELGVAVGQAERLPCRVIAYRLPTAVVNERRRRARANAAKKGRPLTQEALAWLEFACFITNVAATIWSAPVIGTLYRLRWQVELTFKNWKSLLAIHVLKGTRPERIRCLLYGRLIVIVLLGMLSRVAAWYAQAQRQCELSMPKFLTWCQRHHRLASLGVQGTFAQWLEQLTAALPRLCKQKRRRLTTRQLIDNEINYMDSFIDRTTSTQEA
jgi:hypothetical protein